MKRLEELGISPAPWDGVTFCHPAMNGYVVSNANLPDGDTRRKIVASDVRVNNARLIAAAPKLYQALYKITKEQECGKDCSKCKNDLCVIQECRAALAEAAGEEVSDGNH